MTQWIIEKSVGFTDVGLYRISESVRAYAYVILSSQASARSPIVENTTSALTAQSAFLPNNMNLKIKTGTVGYNNKILVSDQKFSLGKNIEVNALELTKKTMHTFFPKVSHKDSKVVAQLTATPTSLAQKQIITHEEEKIALVLFLAGGFTIWFIF